MDSEKNSDPTPAAIPVALRCPMCGGQIAPGSRRCLSCGEVPVPVQPPKPRLFGCGTIVAVLGIGAVCVALMLPAVRRAPEAGRRTQCLNNIRNIAVALHNYAEVYQAFPPAYTVDAQGQPLHSWRTLILPFLDQKSLYETIDLSKPWDAPENAAAFQTHIALYSCPSTTLPRNHTTYLASVGPEACLRPAEPRNLSEITDGVENTLLVIEVPPNRSVPWMSPMDGDEQLILSIAANSKLAHTGVVTAGFCDTRVRTLSNRLPAATWRALISIAGDEQIEDF